MVIQPTTMSTDSRPEQLNNLRAFLLGGEGTPTHAPQGLLALRGMTVEQLARAAKLTRTAIYSYIEAKCTPTVPTLRRICEALGAQFQEALNYCTPVPIGRPRRQSSNVSDPREKSQSTTRSSSRPDEFKRLELFERNSKAQKRRREFEDKVRLALCRGNESNPAAPPKPKEELVTKESDSGELAFATELQRLMDQQDPPMEIKEVAKKIGISYEHARKLVRGLAVPTAWLCRDLARFFAVDAGPFAALAQKDRFEKKYGESHQITVSDEGLTKLASNWQLLTDQQKQVLLSQLTLFLAQNLSKAGAVHGAVA